jgi:hypothetical protein
MGRQRWLGFLAIGLGVLVILTMLPHRGWSHNVRYEVPRAVAIPAMPAAPVAPAPPVAPQPVPPAFVYGGGPWMHHGWGGPGFLINGLLKAAMIFFLVALGLRLLRGPRGPWGPPFWRHAGPGWRHGPPPWQEYAPPPPPAAPAGPPPAQWQQPAQPTPVEPPTEGGPQTGPTTRL